MHETPLPHDLLSTLNIVTLAEIDNIDHRQLLRIGAVEAEEQLAGIEVCTERFLRTRQFPGGWQRGGAESFYKVLEVVTNTRSYLLALKAIHSLGSITGKVVDEALRLAALNRIGRAPKVYAVTPGIIIKEFLLPDHEPLPQNDLLHDAQLLLQEMRTFGFRPTHQPLVTSVISASVQHCRRLKIVDAGSGDFETT